MDIPAFLTEPITKGNLNPPVEEHLQNLPYDQISWENFEKLCLALALKENDVSAARKYGVKGDVQHGIDIYALSSLGKYEVYQCKNEKNFGKQKIQDAVNVFLKGEWASDAERFVLCARENLNNRQREDEIKAQRKILSDKGIGFDIWDNEELNIKLKDQPQIVYDFFGINWLVGFCGKEKLSVIEPHVPLPEKNIYDKPADYFSRSVTKSDEDSFSLFFEQNKTLLQAFKSVRKIALLAWGLDGKSTEMQHLAYMLSLEAEYFPFLISLGTYSDESIESLIPGIELIPQTQLAVLLDGLDEVLPDQFALATRKIARFLENYPLSNIVVSCRTNYYTTFLNEDELNTLKGFASYRLNQLGYEDIEKYLIANLAGNHNAFFSAINEKQLYELLKTPYYLVKLTKRFLTTGNIVNSKAGLFKEEINRLVKTEIARNHKSNHELLERKLYDLLRQLAFVMEVSGTNFISNSDLQKVVPDEKDRKLITEAAALFYGTDVKNKTWRFHHHNTQEYLTAEKLSTQSFKALQEIVGIEPEYKKIKPSWLDTLLFLISILANNSPLKMSLVDWLSEDNKEMVIKLEPDKIDKTLREKIFKKIFNQYKSDARRINATLYRYDDLANFAVSDEILAFLLTELRETKEVNNRANALELATSVDLRQYPQYTLAYKDLFKELLLDNDPTFHFSALLGYTEQNQLTLQEFDTIFQRFKTTKDDLIRPQLFRAIAGMKFAEHYADDILKHTKLLIEEERQRFNSQFRTTRHGNEYGEIAKCLNSIKSADGLIKLFSSLKNEVLILAKVAAFEKTLAIILQNALAHTGNSILTDLIDQVFRAEHTFILHDIRASEAFRRYYVQSNLMVPLCAEFANKLLNNDASMVNTISMLADTGAIDILHKRHQADEIHIATVQSLNYFFEKNDNPNLLYLREKFAIPEPAPIVKRNFEEIQAETRQRNLAALFSQDEFEKEITLIYTGMGKDTLSYADLDFSRPDFWSENYASVARDFLDIRPQNAPVKLSDIIAHIQDTWGHGYFSRIYDYLVKNEGAELTSSQIDRIISWCNLEVGAVSFLTAVDRQSYRSWSVDERATLLCYFIRKFNLTEYPKALYLDMLSFIKHDDSLIDIIPFVESTPAITKADISATMLANLHTGLNNSELLKKYLDYIDEHKIIAAAPLLVPYFSFSEIHNRSDILKLYLKLGGDLATLKDVLINIDDDFFPYLIEPFLKVNDPLITVFLKSRFQAEADETKKLSLAKYLIRLQQKVGIQFYLDYIVKHKFVPDESFPENPLFWLHETQFVWPILELFKLGHNPEIRYSRSKDLKSISFQCLQNIALYGENFKKTNRIIKLWVSWQYILGFTSKSKIAETFSKTLKLYWEGITKQRYVNAGRKFSVDEAILLFGKLN